MPRRCMHRTSIWTGRLLTSTGFGEITPVTKMARSLIIIEHVLGVMYVAFLIARLANLYRNSGKHQP